MINRENLAKWTAKLRDPALEQTTQVLRTPEGAMCCLGVAIDMWHPDTWESGMSTSHDVVGCKSPYQELQTGAGTMPSLSFMRETFGFTNRNQYVKYAEMNDQGSTFAEIADEIEKDWLK